MAIAPQNLMTKLRFMEDAELANFAAKNKNDPYIFPLAFQESQNRKHVRAAEQAKGAGQQQPKVVDQDLAEMTPTPVMSGSGVPVTAGDGSPVMSGLPENSGIAQIPAKNLESMAGGGIVAFEEGGEVPRFNTGGVPARPVQRMPGDPAAIAWDSKYGATHNPNGTPKLAAEYVRNPETKTYEKNPVRAEQDMAMFEQASDAFMANRAAQQAAAQDSGAADGSGAGVDTLLGNKGNQSAAPAATPGAGLPSLKSYKQELEDVIYKNAPKKEDALKEAAEIDKPLLEKMQANIDKESSRLKTDKEQDFYMSLIQGGLAAAAESGPNALQNIAKGFSVGAGSYKEALKDFRKATQENSKMEMELAKYEATGKKDALKAYNEAQARRDDRYADGITRLATQEMSGKYQLAATREHAAATKSNGPLAIYNALGGGDLAKGFQLAKQIEAGNKKDLMTEYTSFLTANPALATEPPEKSAAAFLKTKGLFDLATGMQTQIKPVSQPVGKVFQ